MPVKTAFENVHVLLQVDPAPGRAEHFFADAEQLLASDLNLAIFGSLTPASAELALTVTMPVDASEGILAAIQETPGVLGRDAKERIHNAIAEHVRETANSPLVISVRHSILAPSASSPAMPVALAAV